jgi:hypothetical protein
MSYNFAQFPQKCISLVNKCISYIKLVIADTPFNNPDFQDFLISVIQREPFCLQYVSHPTTDMFVVASRYVGALGLVKNQSPEIVNYALRKNTFNKYQLNRSGIESLQELVRYKVGVDYDGLCFDEIYAFANDMQTSIMDICINHIIKESKLSQNDIIDFSFFCLHMRW